MKGINDLLISTLNTSLSSEASPLRLLGDFVNRSIDVHGQIQVATVDHKSFVVGAKVLSSFTVSTHSGEVRLTLVTTPILIVQSHGDMQVNRILGTFDGEKIHWRIDGHVSITGIVIGS